MVTLFEVEHTLRLFNRYYKANIISDDLWIVYIQNYYQLSNQPLVSPSYDRALVYPHPPTLQVL